MFGQWATCRAIFKSYCDMNDLKCYSKGFSWVEAPTKVHIFWEGHKILRNLHRVDLSYVVTVKSTVEISENFMAFSEYMNFTMGVQSKWNYAINLNSKIFTYLLIGKEDWLFLGKTWLLDFLVPLITNTDVGCPCCPKFLRPCLGNRHNWLFDPLWLQANPI